MKFMNTCKCIYCSFLHRCNHDKVYFFVESGDTMFLCQLKGIVWLKLEFHPFTSLPYVDGGCGDFSSTVLELHEGKDFHPMPVQCKPVVAMYYNTKKTGRNGEETHNILPR